MFSKFILILLIPSSLLASTLLAPDSDTAALYQILSTSISQLNEMEKLVSKSEKYTSKIQDYNELVEDQLDRARRIKEYAEFQVYLLQAKPENLAEVNDLIRELSSSIEDLESLKKEYQMVVIESDLNQDNAKTNSKELQKNTHNLKKQAMQSRSQLKGATEQIRINTANTAIETSKTNEILNKISSGQDQQANMEAKENLRQLKKEEEKEQYYQVNQEQLPTYKRKKL